MNEDKSSREGQPINEDKSSREGQPINEDKSCTRKKHVFVRTYNKPRVGKDLAYKYR